MSDQDIFDKSDDTKSDDLSDNIASDNEDNDVTPKPKDDEPKPVEVLLKGIVNDDGTPKYKSIEDALTGAIHAQNHIKKLENELADLRSRGESSEKLDELLAAIKQSKGSGEDDSQDDDSPTLKPEDVIGIVKQYVNETKSAEEREKNINTVVKTFRDRFGKDASKELYGKATDLGFSREEINRMIASNPNAALKVLGIVSKEPPSHDPTVSNTSVASERFQGDKDTKPKPIMGSTKKGDLEEAWRVTKQRTYKRLGVEDPSIK